MDTVQNNNIVVQLDDISKRYPGVIALDKVSLKMEKGKVHALLGENGAGKSTIIKIISGVISPDEGNMLINNQPVKFDNPRQAFRGGINVVHQERNIIPTFTVGENIMLERIAGRGLKSVNIEQIHQESLEFLDMVGLQVSPARLIEELSVAEIQLVEIAKALSSRANILLLDEPTASLSYGEAASLLKTIRNLQEQGVSFLYVTHKTEEVFEIANMVTVLRDGKKVGETLPIEQLDRNKLVTLMVGRSEILEPFPNREFQDKEKALEVKNLNSKFSPHNNSFTLNKGEILGWYGLVGAGRSELARVMIGYDPATSGEIFVYNKKAKIKSVPDSLYHWGIGYLSEDRKEEGLFLSYSVASNIAASVWKELVNGFKLLRKNADTALAKKYCDELSIKTPSLQQIVNSLSGGNQQKVSFAKTLAVKPKILIVDEPTQGVDINTKRQIHELIWALSQEGISVIVVSSDMPEIIQLADRILVFRAGKICDELNNSKDYGTMSEKIIRVCLKEVVSASKICS
jgi:ribose transport system ATP-binding protein